NRQDCTGVHGIARDLSAADMGKFRDPAIKPIKGEFPCPVQVTVEDATLCPGFALRLVRGVNNGPSPDWLQKRLSSIGLRPINALVDITNFMTYDRARPLHVFDAAKVQGNLSVRRARDGETLLALDGRTYALDKTTCVIADARGVESLAGIMGGEASGCSEATTDVLIESALWNEINIAHTGRKLGINSDARYRFERGVDPAFMVPGLDMATRLVMEICGGAPSEKVVVGNTFGEDRIIDFPVSEVKRLAGIDVPLLEMKRILGHLGFMLAGAGPAVKIAVPSWRSDVHGKADIVEEIVRIVGVDKVPMTPFERGASARKPILTSIQLRTRRAKRALAARGMVEAVTWSFIAKPQAELFGGGGSERDRPEDQFVAASGVRHGFASSKGQGRHWSGSAMADALDAKGDAFALLSAAGAPMQALQVVPGGAGWLHPGRSGTIQIGPQNVLGYFGELHPQALEVLRADGPLVAFEVILDRIPEAKQRLTRAKPPLELSPFQPVSRDFAFIVDRSIRAGDIVRAAQGVDKKLITDVTVFDVYEGKGIEDGKKSIAITVTMQPREKTMTDQEIDAVGARIVAEVANKTGGTLRA
ncbi:MAG: phenylalanine--tRNA ligase subunit beta, partial [Alphaproteobacteria bacterium]